jgi:cob(I)alamin adenosyltransferase
MKIYTKKGDGGDTSLLGGTRVRKDDVRIEAYGTVDELNVALGALRDHTITQPEASLLQTVQERLFTVGAALAVEDEQSKVFRPDLREEDVVVLEQAIDAMTTELPELRHFILPGGHPAVSAAHLVRVVCRRAERLVIHLAAQGSVPSIVVPYLNRLSDWAFVYGRLLGQRAGVAEVKWEPRPSAAE